MPLSPTTPTSPVPLTPLNTPLTPLTTLHTHHTAQSHRTPHTAQEYMRKFGDPAKVEAVLERVRMELAVYEASPTGACRGAVCAVVMDGWGEGGEESSCACGGGQRHVLTAAAASRPRTNTLPHPAPRHCHRLPTPAGSIPLRPELAALRQRLYKLDNKVKHEFKRSDAGG